MNSGEHELVGDSAPLPGTDGALLPLRNGISVSYGQAIALAGDFYAVPGMAIAAGATAQDRADRFTAALACLQDADPGELAAILKAVAAESAAITAALQAGTLPSQTYRSGHDLAYTEMTGGRYLDLAGTNTDHFGRDALIAFATGHRMAVALAVQASAGGPATLHDAYLASAFAGHFLTDLFSAGHLRVERGRLHAWSTIAVPGASLAVGDYLAMKAHGEDCKYGLAVSNARGDRTVMFGDARIFDPQNAAGLALAREAVQACVQEVFEAYRSGIDPFAGVPADAAPDLLPTDAAALVPDLAKAADPATNPQHHVLFRFDDAGVLHERQHINDLQCATYDALDHEYSALTTALELMTTYRL